MHASEKLMEKLLPGICIGCPAQTPRWACTCHRCAWKILCPIWKRLREQQLLTYIFSLFTGLTPPLWDIYSRTDCSSSWEARYSPFQFHQQLLNRPPVFTSLYIHVHCLNFLMFFHLIFHISSLYIFRAAAFISGNIYSVFALYLQTPCGCFNEKFPFIKKTDDT